MVLAIFGAPLLLSLSFSATQHTHREPSINGCYDPFLPPPPTATAVTTTTLPSACALFRMFHKKLLWHAINNIGV